ncbi:hypothetical protein SH528x_003170 [Novipirellula sp. SH528]|uniref:hypothetical protein n=1 Tax=Novipirellula sp. SH528 TaxID=3454466 RepID=UPI003F9F30EA
MDIASMGAERMSGQHNCVASTVRGERSVYYAEDHHNKFRYESTGVYAQFELGRRNKESDQMKGTLRLENMSISRRLQYSRL